MERFALVIFILVTSSVLCCKSFYSMLKCNSSCKKEEGVPMAVIENTAYRVIAESYYSPFAHSSTEVYVARSLAEVIAISEGDASVVSACEGVDFEKEAVLFAFAGRFNTGGYSVKLKHIEKLRCNKVKVLFSISSPDMEAIVTQAFTSPSLVVAIKVDKGDAVEASFEN